MSAAGIGAVAADADALAVTAAASAAALAADAAKQRELLRFLLRLGQAQLGCGEQTAEVENLLRRIAGAHGQQARVVVFPTAVFIALDSGLQEQLTLGEGPTTRLRLDQIADVFALTQAAERAVLPVAQGLERLQEILRSRARFGALGIVAGHTVLTIGLCMVLKPSFVNLAAAALLGALVGLLKLSHTARPVLSVPTPVIAAALVSALVFLALSYGLPVNPVYVLVPPLVTFLPGAMLTLGMIELAYGDMVSGASRLIAGFVQLVLLAFGLAAGAMLVGYSPESLLLSAEAKAAGAWDLWGPWAAVAVFGVGVYLHFSAPQRSLGWILLVLLMAFGAQQLGGRLFGNEVSGFFGMLVATPLGYLIQHKLKGPPAAVTYLPAFWLVVPGSLGLRSVTHMLSDRAAGLEGVTSAVFAMASIALGTLVGAALYKGLTDPEGWWRLQLRRRRLLRRRASRHSHD